MSLTKDRIGALLLLAFCVFYWLKIGDIRLLPFQANQAFTPRTMPTVLSSLGIILSLAILVVPGKREEFSVRDLNWPLALAFLVLMSVYGLLVRPGGFLLSTIAFLMIGFALLGERRIHISLLVAVPLVVLFWALMNYGLSVFIEPLPFFLRGG